MMTPAQLQAARIVQGIRPTESYDKDPSAWEFSNFLTSLAARYHKDVSTYDSFNGAQVLVSELKMSLVTVYDHPHDSDESCSVDMLLLEGVPLMGWKRIGDRMDYEDGIAVFNQEKGRALAQRVWSMMQEESNTPDPHREEENMDVLAWMFEGNQYLHQLDGLREDVVAYAINDPRFMLGRLDTTEYQLYTINEDNTFAPVQAIVSTAMSPDRYGDNAYHRTTVKMQSGSELEVESRLIVHTPLRDPA